jgi:DNA end-binding protein Ku
MHALWKGTLSFGLVNIPINLFSASSEKEISFILLHKKDLSAIRYARICKKEEVEVPWNEVVKGYEYEPGSYVILDNKDFEKANLKKTKTIQLVGFVNEAEIDSVYYVKPYFLEPEKNSALAYGLLCEALKKTKKVGLARYVLHNREHLAVVKPHKELLILNELRYESELRNPAELDFTSSAEYKKKELDMAVQLIDQQTIPFHPKAYKDTYAEELKELIKQKSKGRPIHPQEETLRPTKVHDIMHLLEESLEQNKKQKKTRKAG